MNFIFQGSQKMHVRVAISQKGLVNFFRYAHQIKAFFIPVQKPVSLFMGRFFPLKFHSACLVCQTPRCSSDKCRRGSAVPPGARTTPDRARGPCIQDLEGKI